MPREVLLEEYRRLIRTLYEPSLRGYFERCLTLFEHLAPRRNDARKVSWVDLRAALRSLRRQLFSRQGPAYAHFFWRVVRYHREHVAEAFRLAIKGYHFERVTSQQLRVDAIERRLEEEFEASGVRSSGTSGTALERYSSEVLSRLDPAFRSIAERAIDAQLGARAERVQGSER